MENLYLFLLVICFCLILIIIWLIKTNHLREKYALLWFFIALMMAFVSIDQSVTEKISSFFGIKYPPTLVFIIAILGLLLLILMLSVIDSHQTNRIIRLTQRIGILENRLSEIERDYREIKKKE